MKDDSEAALMRRMIDEKAAKCHKVPRDIPKRGWVRAVREALCMTAQELGARLSMSQAAVAALELSEVKGSAQLATLRRAAKALNCELVYAFIPEQSLEKTLRKRRQLVAFNQLANVVPLGALMGREYEELIATYAQTIKRNQIWRKIETKPLPLLATRNVKKEQPGHEEDEALPEDNLFDDEAPPVG